SACARSTPAPNEPAATVPATSEPTLVARRRTDRFGSMVHQDTLLETASGSPLVFPAQMTIPTPHFSVPPFSGPPPAPFDGAPADGVLPDGFFSTSNLPTYVHDGGRWVMPERPRMDGVIVRRGATLVVVEPRLVKRGEPIVIGLAEDGT